MATSPSGSRVSICTGDLTQNAPVGVIANFITPNPNTQDGYLSLLLESGGPEVKEDFEQKASDSMWLKPGEKLTTQCHGQLKCSQLIHCVVPLWKGGRENEKYYVEKVLSNVMKAPTCWGSVLITPLTSAPFNYPTNVFVKLVLDAVVSASNIQVTVYVEEIGHANEFQSALLANNFHIYKELPLEASVVPVVPVKEEGPAAAVATSATPNLDSFITLVNGDLLKQQVSYVHAWVLLYYRG